MTGTTLHIPMIDTPRLRMRAHTRGDFDAYAALFASPRAEHMGRLKRHHAWYSFTSDVAGWLLCGHGAWAIDRHDTGAFIGQVALNHPDHFPEPELGWFLFNGAEGQGFATEAATAALDFARDTLGWSSVVSYISPANTRSITLARRLGATPDAMAPLPIGERSDETIVFRHRLAA